MSIDAEADERAVAIIGMACRLPGAPDLDGYRDLLLTGRSGIVRTGDDELRAAGVPAALLTDPDLVRRFGVLADATAFDAGLFGLSPARAAALDPQQRVLMELALSALEHAGIAGEQQAGTIGSFMSLGHTSWRAGPMRDPAESFYALTASDKDYAATRIAYALDLTGPALMVQSACSSSLLAVHQAAEALLSGQCDVAIAGGCSIIFPQGAYGARAGLMLAADGRCRPFDAAATGTVPGNGGAVVVLKPLAAALADGDTVHAVILGSAVANDGAVKADYLAPGVRGQTRAIGEAWSVAGIRPAEIGLIEAHGTGTAIGDPIEIRALARVLAHFRGRGEPLPERCPIGSVKASIGHLNTASGIAGLIKTVLALKEAVLLPQPGPVVPNPAAPWDETPFTFLAEPEPWRTSGRRVACVSSFGFGGTNVHMVLQEPPAVAPMPARPGGVQLLPLSAAEPAALARQRQDLARHLERHAGLDLGDVAHTLQQGRRIRPVRALFRASSIAEAVAALREAHWAPASADPRVAPWLAGETVDWQSGNGVSHRLVPLPTYPFDRTVHALDQAPAVPFGMVWSPAPMVPAAQPEPRPAPAVDLRGWLVDLFAQQLGRDAVALDRAASFPDLGVDSLLVASITDRIRERYPEVRSTLLFERTTLESLAAFLAQQQPAPAAAATAPARAEGDEPLAITGMAVRLPGAPDLDGFWNLMVEGRQAIAEVPAERWHGVPPAGDLRPHRAGLIDDPTRFDALLFGITPKEARRIDPQARQVLELGWAALEDAGITPERLVAQCRERHGNDVGVFVGVMNQGYRLLAAEADATGQVVQANHWSVANRLSYHLDLKGPSLAVDTACSASLTALHLAAAAIRRGECGAALVAGVNLLLHPVQQSELARMGLLAADDACRAFSAGASGMVQGEGAGVLVLRPLADALASGDRILALYRGSALNADGRTGGYTVPSPAAQTELVRRALHDAAVPASSISYIECHGTGTALGDPIEISGLADAFAAEGVGPEAAPVPIGSVKASIGHLESAAGIAGLAKLVLQLRHRRIAPTCHAGTPSPAIDFARTPFRPVTAPLPWSDARGPRRAGLSSFGAGGANAHLVLEEAPAIGLSSAPVHAFQPILLSAAEESALHGLAERLLKRLRAEPALAADPAGLADLAWTLLRGRRPLRLRRGFAARDRQQLVAGLEAIVRGDLPAAGADADLDRRIAAWCVGGGIEPILDWWRGETRRVVALPAYPFQGTPLWLDVGTAAVAPAPVLLPAAEAMADGGHVWPLAFTAVEPLLADHVVGDGPLLPGVASIGLAVAALRAEGGEARTIERLTWRRAAAPEQGRLLLRFRLGADRGFVLLPAEGEAGLVDGRVGTGTVPEPMPLPAGGDDALESWDAARVYARLAAQGLVYGPSLRAIQGLGLGTDHVVAELERPAAARAAYGAWPLCPSLLDGALQAASMILFQEPDSSRVLPFALRRLVLHGGTLPERVRVIARLVDRAGRQVRFAIEVRSPDGVPLLTFEGLDARIDSRPQAKQPVPMPVENLPLFVPRWRPDDAVAARPLLPATGPVAVVHDGPAGPLAAEAMKLLAARQPMLLDLAQAEAAITTGRVDSLVVLHPDEPVLSLPAWSTRLLPLLKAAKLAARPLTLLLVTQGALEVVAGDRPAPWPAAAIGLARTAASESTLLQVGCVDLGGTDDLAAALAGAADPLGLPLAWRRGRRHLLRFRPLAEAAPATLPLATGDHVLVLGGAGGIGRMLAARWSKSPGARLTLIGRSPLEGARAEAIEALRRQGVRIHYAAADITDRTALGRAIEQAVAVQGPVRAAIHAAIVMEDRALQNMDRAVLEAGLEPKRLGALHLAELLECQPLRWLAFFSSANAVAANAGQANYVAGCTVKDAFARALAQRVPWPVRTVNWGYWGEVGRVADDAYRQRMERAGIGSIGVEQGLAAFERILAGAEPQVLALKASDAVLARLGVEKEAPAEAMASPMADGFARADAGALASAEAERRTVAGAIEDHADLDRIAAMALAAWWRQQGLMPAPGRPEDADGLARRFGLDPRHRRQWAALVDMLLRQGVLRAEGELLAAGIVPDDAAALTDARRRLVARSPGFAAHLKLLDACLDAYRPILKGEEPATNVMFPGGSMELVEPMYRGNRMVDHLNRKLASAVLAAAEAAPKDRPFRVLEFGSGTGGTSGWVMERMAALEGAKSFDYTDISVGFARFGRQRYGERFPFARFGVLNIEDPPDPERFPPASFDVVLGANVIHATRRLERSLGHVAGLLRPGGLLMLYEMTANHDFVTVTFGLLDGWWLSEDPRLPHGPLVDPAGWRRYLAKAGFDAVRIHGEPEGPDEERRRHSLIIARKPDPAAVRPVPVVAPVPNAAPSLRERLRKDRPAAAENDVATPDPALLEPAVLALVAATLEIPPERIEPARSLADYGADSVLSVELIQKLNERFAVQLKPTTLFSHPSVQALARHLADAHGVKAEGPPPVAAMPAPAVRREPVGPDSARAVAVIGMAGRFPGADDVAAFWDITRQGLCTVAPVPADRWAHRLVHDPVPLRPGKTVTADGGFLADVASFDPELFGLSPAEATAMDPQQRLFLTACWQALEDAGFDPPALRGRHGSVFAGTVAGDYDRLLLAAGRMPDARSFTGSAPSMLSARIAYHLDLRGPALSIDTACSSALVAVTEAAEALVAGRTELALAGGVAVMATPAFYVVASQAGMLSPRGRCSTLDARGDGFVPAEAVGVVVLKRLDHALRDGDRVLGVLRGWGTNQDGGSNGITAPSARAQAELERHVHERFDIAPASIGLAELHGTGTRLGDPIEIEGLSQAFGPGLAAGSCVLGAAKANIGHALPAAGIVGLIKVLLALQNRTLPPIAGLERPNPLIDLAGTPFRTLSVAEPWPEGATPRRATVSAFGFSGTNAHLVVEEAPAGAAPGRPPRPGRVMARRRCWPEIDPETAARAGVGPVQPPVPITAREPVPEIRVDGRAPSILAQVTRRLDQLVQEGSGR